MPSDRVRQIFFLSEERRAELLALEQPHSEEKLQRFVGHYGAGFQGIHFSLVDGRLAYQSRYYGGSAVAIGENRFVSLLESDMEFEFFTNDAGEVDLCVWRRGQKRYIAYRQEDIALTPRSEGVGRR